jgi:BASS family bile acid:Na+ symporter
MGLRAASERWAARARPWVAVASNVSMVLAVVLLIGLNFDAMLGTFGSGAVAVAVLFVALLLAAGYLLGGPSPGTRSVLGLGTAQRNVAAALVVATQSFTDPGVVVMLLVATLAGLVVLVIAARQFARQVRQPAPAPAAPIETPVVPTQPR